MAGKRTITPEEVFVFQSPDAKQRICRLIDESTAGTKNTAAGLYWLAPGHTHEVDVHPKSEEIYYVVRGRGTLRLDDVPHQVEAGMAVHIPAGTRHQTTNTGDEDLVYFYAYVPPPTEPPNVTEPWTVASEPAPERAATRLDGRRALEAARALVPELRERAAEADRLRRVPDETIASFREAGLFRVLRPRAFGGSEIDYDAFTQLVGELARGCGSSAWNLSVLAMHEWFLALFPEPAQRAVWDAPGGRDALVAAVFAPQGRAEPVAGGFRLSGRWQFASGCDHADWIAVGGVVEGAAGLEEGYRSFLLSRAEGQWAIDDTWFVAGLRGTGSKDVVVEGAFVPEERTLRMAAALSGETPGCEIHRAQLYRLPFVPALGFALATVAPGIAAAALERYAERMRERVYTYSSTRQAEHAPAHIGFAESAAEVEAARACIQRDAAALMARVRRGEAVPLGERARAKRDVAWAVRICTRAVDRIFASSGAHALFETSPLQRAFRDLHAIGMHAMHNFDLAAEDWSRVHLGLEPKNAL